MPRRAPARRARVPRQCRSANLQLENGCGLCVGAWAMHSTGWAWCKCCNMMQRFIVLCCLSAIVPWKALSGEEPVERRPAGARHRPTARSVQPGRQRPRSRRCADGVVGGQFVSGRLSKVRRGCRSGPDSEERGGLFRADGCVRAVTRPGRQQISATDFRGFLRRSRVAVPASS